MKHGKKFDGLKIFTPEFRISFPALLKPRASKKGDPKYEVVMVFPKSTDLGEMKAVAKEAAREKYGDDLPRNFVKPFRDGADSDWHDDDTIFVRASTTRQPGLVDENVQKVIDPSEIYSGRWAQATVVPFCYDVDGNKGVTFGLRNIQLLDHADRFDGGASAESDFGGTNQKNLDNGSEEDDNEAW
jgi:hypothetical protein